MKRTGIAPRWIMAMSLAATSLVACDKDPVGEAGATETKGETSTKNAGDVVADAVDEAEKKAGRRIFDKSLTKRACDILTPELVAKTFDVDAADLKQMKMMGCIYSQNEKGKDEFKANFTTIMTHKSEDVARQWFQNATKGMTQEEAKKAMAQITEKTKEHEKVDTELKKKTVDKLGGLLGETGKRGIQYESVSGVGDEARLNLSDGGLWIRVGNTTFVVAAYQGPRQPPPDLKGVALKEMAKIAMETNRKWLQETMPERKAAAIKLGKVVVDQLR